ncbi:MAG: two-component regulator propeller domain-containing protein [Tenuifilaceae bacterium]
MNWLLSHIIRSIFCTLIAIIVSFNSKAVNVELYNIDNGLTQTAITGIIQDSYGFLWISTQDGLNRFDGYQFKIYRNNPLDSNSLSNNYINAICEDRAGNIWLGTNVGLSFYNRATGKFTNYYNIPNNNQSISDNRIYNVYEDKRGNIWIKTLTSLDKFNPKQNIFTRYPHFTDLFTFSTDVNDFAIFEDSRDVLWVGTKDGLSFFDRQLGLFKRFSHDPNNPKSISNDKVKDIFEDSKGNLWIGTEYGLNIFNPLTNEFKHYFSKYYDPNALQSNIINVITEDYDGNIWIGTDKGFCSFDTKTQKFNNYNNLIFKGERLIPTSVTSICEDRSRILWIGSFQGLMKIDLKPAKFKLYSKDSNGNPLFSNNLVASLLQDYEGNVWVGTWGAGLFLYNPKTGQNIQYSTLIAGRRIINDFIHAIFQTKQKDIIIGTRDGVQVYNPISKQFEDYFQKEGINPYGVFRNNRVYSFAEDQFGNLWIATRAGLFQVTKKSIIEFYNDPTDTTSITSGEVYDVIVDKEGIVWAGTLNGLNKIDPVAKKIKRYERKPIYSGNELISNEILALLEDSNGFIWIGTSSGLHKLDKKSDKIKLYTQDNGLPNNLIYSLEEDNKGKIWMSTNWGIAELNPESELTTSFDIADGLQSHEFNVGSSFKSKSGELFFGGISGFNSFFPDSINLNKTKPSIVITSFDLMGKKGKDNLLVTAKNEVHIPKDVNLFTIEFSVLDFTHSDKNQYAYKMTGLTDQWIDNGNKRSATFTNLNAGIYYFSVKGANSDLVWNEEGITLKIIVETYLWKTRVAVIFYAIVFVLSVFIYLRYRTKNLRETNQLLKDRESAMVKIEKQKEELIFKNKNITDSINYAKRIQEAIMPSVAHFKRLLPDSFILYMPKDIVSGDFYWVNETKNKIFVAVIDCTGHGVPGAFMSIIGVELLRNITNIQGVNDAAEILNRLNIGIVDTFSKGLSEDSVLVKDGMDVAFCIIDKENNTLQYAGAFSNLYLIRDSKITEIKGDRYSVGMGNDPQKQLFSSHYIPIQPDDMIYIFTDGYVDQFGGTDMKKYKFRRFRHLLLNIHKFPLETQRQYLEDSIIEWKGNHDQVDDILIIGIKPDLSCLF